VNLGVTEDLIPVVKANGERHLTAVAVDTDAVNDFADDLPTGHAPVPAAAAVFALAATKTSEPVLPNQAPPVPAGVVDEFLHVIEPDDGDDPPPPDDSDQHPDFTFDLDPDAVPVPF
jgi:hypothetical protein